MGFNPWLCREDTRLAPLAHTGVSGPENPGVQILGTALLMRHLGVGAKGKGQGKSANWSRSSLFDCFSLKITFISLFFIFKCLIDCLYPISQSLWIMELQKQNQKVYIYFRLVLPLDNLADFNYNVCPRPWASGCFHPGG